jgi:hypothetical protein
LFPAQGTVMPRRTRASTKPAPSTAHTALLADLAALFERHGVALGRAVRLLPDLGAPLEQLLAERHSAWLASQGLLDSPTLAARLSCMSDTPTCSRSRTSTLEGEAHMGASEWRSFVPYQSDLQQALLDLQAAAFQQGDYWVRPAASLGKMTFEEYLPPDWADWDMTDEELEGWRNEFEALQAEVQPVAFTSIEELREWNGEEGLHSILDMLRVGDAPSLPAQRLWFAEEARHGLIWPPRTDQLMQLFGTTEPTRVMVEGAEDQLVGCVAVMRACTSLSMSWGSRARFTSPVFLVINKEPMCLRRTHCLPISHR